MKINFLKNLSGTLSECQTVWIEIRTNILSVLLWVQTVCKDYHQKTEAATSMKRVNAFKISQPVHEIGPDRQKMIIKLCVCYYFLIHQFLHMFWLRNEKINVYIKTHIKRPEDIVFACLFDFILFAPV